MEDVSMSFVAIANMDFVGFVWERIMSGIAMPTGKETTKTVV